MDFKEILKELRKESGKTQQSLCDALNIPRYTLSNWEQGRCEPSAKDLILLADFFDISIDKLLGREDDFGIINTPTPVVSRLTEKEERLLDAFKNLTELEQDKLIDDAEFYANRRGASTYTAIKK